jgi:CubicO group peptidase (beta-lactamase class C family)
MLLTTLPAPLTSFPQREDARRTPRRRLPPISPPVGTRAEYSDIGFIILGIALSVSAEAHWTPLSAKSRPAGHHHYIQSAEILKDKTAPPPTNLRSTVVARAPPATVDSSPNQPPALSAENHPGRSQDENASVLGGVAAHAGLFATAEDVAIFAHALLNGGYPILRPETINLFTRRESSPAGTSRALGWDTPSNPSQSGKHFGPRSYGHLGYTGTSLWIDPDRQLSITLLTNRIWPDCRNQAIKQLRPAFHDAVIESLKSRGIIP